LYCLLFFACTFSGPAQAASDSSAWWNSAWSRRLTVLIDAFPSHEESPEWSAFDVGFNARFTASIELQHPEAAARKAGGAQADDIRVVDAEGNIVPHRVYSLGKPDVLTVKFPVERRNTRYYIYYGNDAAEPPPDPPWYPTSTSLTLSTLRLNTERFAGERGARHGLDDLKAVLRGQSSLHGRQFINRLMFDSNPTNLAAPNERGGQAPNYITGVEGIMRCEASGEYQFSIDSGGPAYFLINDELVAFNEGTGRLLRNKWPKAKTVKLNRGQYHVRLIVSERHTNQGFRLGWQLPGTDSYEVVPLQAFVSEIKAKPIAYDEQNARRTIFFAIDESSTASEFPDAKVVTAELLNLSKAPSGVSYFWRINGSKPLAAHSLRLPFRAEETYEITLIAELNDRRIGSHTRYFRPMPQYDRKPVFGIEPTRVPNIIFLGERENLSFRIASNFSGSTNIDWTCRIRELSGGRIIEDTAGTVLAEEFAEGVMSIPFETVHCDGDRSIEVDLSLLGIRLDSISFRVMPVASNVSALNVRDGAFFDDNGRQVILAMRPIDEAEFRKWAISRAIAAFFASRSNVFLYGNPMDNISNAGVGSYIEMLRETCRKNSISLDFVRRGEGLDGLLADVPRFAAALARRKPPVIVISPGLTDIESCLPLRDYERSLHVMIELARRVDSQTRIVLVSPPPYTQNLQRSMPYRDSTQRIAEKARVRFADIHTRLNPAGAGWTKFYQSSLGDPVFYTYPLNTGQKLIADTIFELMK